MTRRWGRRRMTFDIDWSSVYLNLSYLAAA